MGGTVGILDFNLVGGSAELAGNLVFLHIGADTGINLKTVVGRLDSQDELGDGVPVPGGCAGEPGVFALAGTECILTRYHLGVDVGFNLVQGLVLDVGRADFAPVFHGSLAVTADGFTNDDPRIVVTEYAGILLVTCGIT